MRTRICLVLLVGCTPLAAVGQIRINRATQFGAVSFRVDGGSVPDPLEDEIVSRGRGGLVGLRRALHWLPFISPVVERPFDPLEVQRDKERLRQYMSRVGYPSAAIEYDAVLHTPENLIDVTFRISTGLPRILRSLAVEWTDRSGMPSDFTDRVLAEARRSGLREGVRLDERSIAPARSAVLRWLGDQGHAFGSVEPHIAVDSARREARVVFRAAAGPRARIGTIAVEGASRLTPDAARRQLSVHSGDWFSPTRLQAAAERFATLDVVRRAAIEVPPGQPVDTVVNILVRVQEEAPRVITGQLGYTTDGGITAEGQWTHRYFAGAARAFTATLTGKSGALALDELAEKEVRGSLTLRQGNVGSPRLSLNLGPFAVYRNDYRDRSFQTGLETTLVYRLGTLSSVSLRHELSTRRIFAYRFGDFFSGVDLLGLLQLGAQGVLDSLGGSVNANTVTLAASVGRLDPPADPRRGFIVEPSVTTAIPGGLSSTEYVTGNVRTTAYLPAGRAGTIALRLGGGKLLPLGKSVPSTREEGFIRYLQLRDVLLTAGGMGDVRGWPTRLLGPKFPAIIIPVAGDSLGRPYANSYTPIGGFNRIYGSLEVRVPLPFARNALEGHVFVDAGRVWTHDTRFTDNADPYGVEKLFWSPGIGLDYITVIGAIRVDLAYKLNPSILDLAYPGEVSDAILAGRGLTDLPRHNGRRFQLHFSIGRRL